MFNYQKSNYNIKPLIKKLRSAFSLLEVSIIITAASVVVTSLLALKDKSDEGNKLLITEQRISAVKVAVAAYFVKNGHFPCPADPSINIKERLVGESQATTGTDQTCDNAIVSSDSDFYVGSVPTLELGLSYEYMLDGFGNKFSFIVPADLATDEYLDVPDNIENIPSNYANLILWMDASEVSGITMDASNYVSQMNDKSGNDYHFKQNTSAYRPLFVRDGDYPAISFDGVNDSLYIDTNYYTNTGAGYDGSISDLTVFVVFKTTKSGRQTFISYDNSEYFRVNMHTSGALRLVTIANGEGNASLDTPATSYSDDKVYILTARYKYSSGSNQLQVYVNNSLKDNSAPYTTAPKLGTGTTRYGYIGAGSEASSAGGDISSIEFFEGLIYEIIFYENSLTTANISVVNSYLEEKWKNGGAAYQAAGPFLQIEDIASSVIEDEAVFAIVSYGPTGVGAYRKSGEKDGSEALSYNVLAGGFDSQSIITDYTIDGANAVKYGGWKEGFSQIVRYFTLQDIQNITE